MSNQTLAAMLKELYALQRFGIRPGLETEQALLAQLGQPEKNLRCIHVAGTNGKGSVCAMLESVLRAAGLKTALYTSPHLIAFNERVRVAGDPIPDSALLELLPDLLEAGRSPGTSDGRAATFFELTTALAFVYFAAQQPDIVILETGMGGRWDATNVITPLAAVITDISLEHTEYLGHTLAAIAGEKCGIIKQGRPVILGELPEEALQVARATAAERQAPLLEATMIATVTRRRQDLDGQQIRVETVNTPAINLCLPLPGRHQLRNVALAAAVLSTLFGDRMPPATLRDGLESVRWPARLQVLRKDPPVLLDGAHNPAGARTCAATLKDLLPRHTPVGLVTGMCTDKDLEKFMDAFQGLAKRCWAVPLRNPRGMPAQTIAQAAARRGWEAVAGKSPGAALE
ncbi:MAG: bifunctional folylpolyglutamate synthase/dihydrofolate synthase, partial [Lentisphaerae bacterium]|nr:bifunctional folylpolyglutamate synthase/dihydrofolate synthase [Lentisphaerota bacterium]